MAILLRRDSLETAVSSAQRKKAVKGDALTLRNRDPLTERLCDFLCKLNLPCRLAIMLDFDGLCLSFGLPCPFSLLSSKTFQKAISEELKTCLNCGYEMGSRALKAVNRMKTFEVWKNLNPETVDHYPYEIVEIDEDGSNSIALFEFDADAEAFKHFKEDIDDE